MPDFHLMTLAVMKKAFKKYQPRIVNYRSYKHSSNETFIKDFLNRLSNEVFVYNDTVLQRICELSVDDLHLYLKCHSSTGVFQTFC